MHVPTVCYGHPADPASFDAYYVSTHVPLTEKLPGMASFTYRHCESLDGSQPPYYLLAELSFASREALDAALASPEGGAAAAAGGELRHRRRHDVHRPRLTRPPTRNQRSCVASHRPGVPGPYPAPAGGPWL